MTTLKALANLIQTKRLGCEELIRYVLAGIASKNNDTNAFIESFNDQAISIAKQQDKAIANGETLPPFAGIPMAIKDNMCLEGEHVSCASKMLQNYRSPYTATAVLNAMGHGFVPVGRTNMDEFAMGSSNEHSFYGPVSNPWNLDAVSGGSSGGSAAAVASGLVPFSLGSDTGGSIRQPASFCGVVGLKPTYGRVSRYGLVAFASSLDQIGPFTQSVEDAAYALEAICGFDPNDSTSNAQPLGPVSSELNLESFKGKRIGVPNELMSDHIAPDVKQAIQAVLDQMAALGAHVELFDFPILDESLATYYIIAPAEASSNLSRFDGVRYGHRNTNAATLKQMIQTSRDEGFGDEVKRRIILGTYVLSSGYYDAYYGKAQQMRSVVTDTYTNAFSAYDLICTPTAPTTAFKKGAHLNDPMSMYLSDIATIPVNLAGLPALSLPCGLDANGMPIGFQMIAPWFQERELMRAAHLVESAIQFKPKHQLNIEGALNAV
ncbi:MAG: Asp-tRNA(Asn)/Glu-tRNA(Gln) amidotransferase subunit GatA [Candidatus Margulisbacteria bacterium]|nr:Asp-tRNA(Asn)/Glu-tRNA(Gln) amidotransferase subunit GatA [Candidatus Margulisiibacteriota bacterium]